MAAGGDCDVVIGLVLSLLSFLALMSDAYTTHQGIREGLNETNPIRLWFINKLGLIEGTFGLALAMSSIVAWINLMHQITPTVVFMNIVVIIFSLYAAFNNWNKMR